MLRWFALAVIALALGQGSSPPKLSAQVPNTAPEFRVEVGCSETELRMVIAVLTLKGDRTHAAAQRVDVTVFKQGFERGLFASVPADRGGKFERAPGLEKLGREPGRPFDLVAESRFDERKDLTAIQVTHLEPGLLYHWRVSERNGSGWVGGSVISVEAPVCVSDERKER